MTKQVQIRRGTDSQHTSFTGAEGEISVNTTNDSVHVHDGTTAGGKEMARADGSNVAFTGGTIDGAVIGGTTPAAGTFTTGDFNTSLNVDGTITSDGLTVDGNTGLGTASPSTTLDVVRNGVQPLRVQSTSGTEVAINMVNTGGNVQLEAHSGDFTIDADAVGIGTTSPSGLMSFAKGSRTLDLKLEDTAATGDVGVQLRAGSGDYFGIAAGGGTGVGIVLDDSNNVGIGTSSPDAILHTKASGQLLRLESTAATGSAYLSYYDSSALKGHVGYTGGSDDDFNIFNAENANIKLFTNGTERLRIDSSGNVGIGTSSPSSILHLSASNDPVITLTDTGFGASADITGSNGNLRLNSQTATLFDMADSEIARFDTSGNLHVGRTTANSAVAGFSAQGNGVMYNAFAGRPYYVNRLSSDGDIIEFAKDGTTVGSIASKDGDMAIGTGDTGLRFIDGSEAITPHNTSTNAGRDNAIDLGSSGSRFDDIYATNGTIQTSDQNEKQQIASLTDAEITAAKAISKLFKTFKWNDSVEEKGDAARTHAGVIAQDVQQAMTDAGLDAGDYAFFISATWWEAEIEVPAVEAVEAVDAVYEDVVIEAVLDDDGNEIEPERTEQRLVSEAVEAVEAQDAYTRMENYNTAEEAPEGATERTRMGIRYPELLAFIGAATEQRLADIETRLTALEN